ncbi:MAG: thiamine/thiamine pyrophosphate ABC transporter permease ThiP [Pseudomonadota bacterium]
MTEAIRSRSALGTGSAAWLTAAFGWGALLLVALLAFGTVLAVLWRAGVEEAPSLGPAGWAALRFTVLQAVLSTLLSVAIAVPLARALARRRFPGRRPLMTVLGAPFLLPVIVAVFGLLAVWGRSGLASQIGGQLGLAPFDIYGLSGVVLAHVFFNLPLVARILLRGWAGIPAEHFRLAAQLGMGPGAVFRLLELPMLRAAVPGAALLVFLLCATSFAVALTLGGGPRATTLEVAIYQAIRFEFDLGQAALLAVVQFALCAGVALVALRVARAEAFGPGLDRPVLRPDVARGLWCIVDRLVIGATVLFIGLPLVAVLERGLVPLLSGLPSAVWAAAGRSLVVALGSAALVLLLALAVALLLDRLAHRLAEGLQGLALLGLATSPIVLGTGLFLVVRPFLDPFALVLPVTMLVNAVMTLPFALVLLRPEVARVRRDYGMLAESLGMAGRPWLRHVVWPRLRAPIGFSTGIAAALSMGDLGVVALFAPPGGGTLPLEIQGLMAAYRMETAAGASLLLVLLSFALFAVFDRAGRS